MPTITREDVRRFANGAWIGLYANGVVLYADLEDKADKGYLAQTEGELLDLLRALGVLRTLRETS